MDLTFDESVKRQKAVEWLLINDPVVRGVAEYAKLSPVASILIGAEHGGFLAGRVAEVAKRMVVTDQERREGYPLPGSEAERIRRAQVRANAADLSHNGHSTWKNITG